ncbi:hypothetical protein C1645_828360 [Glomus cerebriforme]|uniref:Uncharacterized protein n=1 Tax=Glomus cerebriforme TaxID=658196 RepID=A0A397SMW7_9GLOM|nr:hypothetical protein C1645_828360 [Glomus cerebriforme]
MLFLYQVDIVTGISRPALRTLLPKVFFLTLQKRFRGLRPMYDDPFKDKRILSSSASSFNYDDLKTLRVSYEPATKYSVIPNIKVTIPEQYVLPEINYILLCNAENFDIKNFDIKEDRVKTFVNKLHDVLKNSGVDSGTSESTTDTLINDLLLHVVKLDNWPFKVRLQPPVQLIAKDESVEAEPKFVVNKEQISLIGVEDKHLRNKRLYPALGFGECQIAAEILACGYENMINNYVDQEIFAFRVISTYVTFYRTKIPTSYWAKLSKNLPSEESIVIKRWPEKNGKLTGLNLANPEGRKMVITDLIKIRQYLLGS